MLLDFEELFYFFIKTQNRLGGSSRAGRAKFLTLPRRKVVSCLETTRFSTSTSTTTIYFTQRIYTCISHKHDYTTRKHDVKTHINTARCTSPAPRTTGSRPHQNQIRQIMERRVRIYLTAKLATFRLSYNLGNPTQLKGLLPPSLISSDHNYHTTSIAKRSKNSSIQ